MSGLSRLATMSGSQSGCGPEGRREGGGRGGGGGGESKVDTVECSLSNPDTLRSEEK